MTTNFNVECRFLGNNKKEITQEWRCKQKGGYVYAAVSPNVVTGVIKPNNVANSQISSATPKSVESELVKCELKQNDVIVGYVEVSQQDCNDLKGL